MGVECIEEAGKQLGMRCALTGTEYKKKHVAKGFRSDCRDCYNKPLRKALNAKRALDKEV